MSKSPPARGDTHQVSGKRQRQRRGRPVCVCAGPVAEDAGIQERWLVAPTSSEDCGAPSSFLSQEGGHSPSDEGRDPGCRPHGSWPHPGTLRPSRLLSHAWALSHPDSGKPPDHPSHPCTDGDPEAETAAERRQHHCAHPRASCWHLLPLPWCLSLPPLPFSPPQLWNLKAKMKGRTQDTGGCREPAPALQQLEQLLDCDAPTEVRRASGAVGFMDSGEVGGGATRTG